MTKRTKSNWTLAGIISGATLVLASLGMLANGIVSLDKKVGTSVQTAVAESLFVNDSLMVLRIRRIERHLGLQASGSFKPIPRAKSEGLVRRVFRLLF